MNKIKSLFAIGLLAVSTFSLAEEQQRYASITHTSSNFINQGYCGYSFTLDNGGNHMVLDHAEFGALEITLRMKDGQGKVLGDTVLEVEPFGDSSATRATFAGLEIPCEDVAEFQVIKAVEEQNGHKVELPLSTFQANNPKLAKMSVAGKK
ncbi:IrmA family protein [Providencia rettgeri]|uniref:IrmA family protein n=1 Tax=Providencia rettgeri TaxID=587 RepID=UPI0005B4EE5D|nr:IrmA family protein [Providencia rettgeri]